MEKQEQKAISVKLQGNTIARLRKLKHRGQSWDGLINEMMDKLGENNAIRKQNAQ
jgi:hypothetical protein